MQGHPNSNIVEIAAEFKHLCPAGFALALHMHFTSSKYLFVTYPKAWTDHYSRNGLLLKDTTVRWAIGNEGIRLWSDFIADGDAGILEEAQDFGLKFGATVSHEWGGTRSLGGFARHDRDFSEIEGYRLRKLLRALHKDTAQMDFINPSESEALRKLSVDLTTG